MAIRKTAWRLGALAAPVAGVVAFATYTAGDTTSFCTN